MDTGMQVDADAICKVLGLGVPCGSPEPVTGGSSAECWQVRTGHGRWMVKAMQAPAAWQLREMLVSGRLERAAYQADVPVAEPTGSAFGYWVRVGRDSYTRASAWVDGRPPAGLAAGLAAALSRGRGVCTRTGWGHLPRMTSRTRDSTG
jgi:hypothetical protein